MKDINQINQTWQKYKETASPQLKEELIVHYSPIIKYVANRLAIHTNQHMDFDDLVSYGVFGLIDAIDKFDLLKGVKFETYATLRIKGAIIDGIRSQDWVPRTLRQKNKKLEQAYASLETELNREPTEAELAKKLDTTPEEVKKMIEESNLQVLISLEDYTDNINLNTNSVEDIPEKYSEMQDLRRILTNAIDELREKEKMVVTLYYFEEMSLKEISKILGVTESRISQIHTKALWRMQNKLGDYKYILFS